MNVLISRMKNTGKNTAQQGELRCPLGRKPRESSGLEARKVADIYGSPSKVTMSSEAMD